ncbi:MAG TPA: UvrD-helicase domain-containing protein [Pseudonocardiaceae bacterium]|jgi:hypothetical protein|nr:UvrD-helicase domain-containing protein [Pseudonocardiaceae bacterium]
MNLSLHQQRQLQQRAVDLLRQTAPWLGPLERRVLTALMVRTAQSGHLFIRRSPPSADILGVDAFLVGSGGVMAITIAETSPDEQQARGAARHAEERCAAIRGPGGQVLARSALHHIVILPGALARGLSPSSLYQTYAEADLDRLFRREPTLNRPQTASIANQAISRWADYQEVRPQASARAGDAVGLLDAAEVTMDQLVAAQQRPFETWMTFLHPQQQAIATRDYAGPARISGPAGTGKTVVALHRLRHLARHSVGPLLFTTFVRTLPGVHKASFQRLAPEFADRVQFINLHAWIRAFLTARGRPVSVHRHQVDNAFGRAWLACRDPLVDWEPTPGYWRTEIDRVIKGRGVTTLEDYAGVLRRGRSVRLNAEQLASVWRLYESYQRNLDDKQLHDYNDVITLALTELVGRPLEQSYAAVVVDEVQDITLTGLRLMHELAGDGPNRLLLVGDGQQQVYPGGWRLSEAGIPVRGRGEVLRVNYRNRAEVLGFARSFDAANDVDDLDGAPGVSLAQVESANPGGAVHRWHGSDTDLAKALVDTVTALPVPRGQAAVITFSLRDLDRCIGILQRAGIPSLHLDRYTGEPDGLIKVGTVHRAKGLDFQAVLAVAFSSEVEVTVRALGRPAS